MLFMRSLLFIFVTEANNVIENVLFNFYDLKFFPTVIGLFRIHWNCVSLLIILFCYLLTLLVPYDKVFVTVPRSEDKYGPISITVLFRSIWF